MTILLVLFVIFSAARCADVERVTVVTSRGPVRGQRTSDGDYTTFFGVPYAKVDEDNPFGMSLAYPHFETPFDASNSTIRCHQVFPFSVGMVQCLRLNIYVPSVAQVKKNLPILVWFYGGGFLIGSAGEYGGQYLVKHDIIVVTLNYRLGPYGFLCLDDPTVPGNQGLKDQITALRWVKENIGAFGGDENKITIAGESYGGGSVDLHLYSLYEKLFDKAIIQSGSMYAEALFVKADHNAAIKLANYLGNTTKNTQDALKFLARADPLEVMGAARNLTLLLRACKEKAFKGKNVSNFMTQDIFHLQSTPKLRDTPILIGYNSIEDFKTFVNQPDEFYTNLGDIFYNKLNFTFALKRRDLEVLAKILRKFYLGGKPISKESMLELSDFSSDYKLNYATEWSASNYIKHGAGNVYKYMFSYVGGSVYKNVSGVGAYHTEEIPYLFEWSSALSDLKTEEQILMRNRMTKMWTNFVKTGDPTPEVTELLPVQWVPVTNASRPYLNIDVEMEMRDQAYNDRMAFWELIWRIYWKDSAILKQKQPRECHD